MATRRRRPSGKGMTTKQRAYKAGAYTPVLKWARDLCERKGKRHSIPNPLPHEKPPAPE